MKSKQNRKFESAITDPIDSIETFSSAGPLRYLEIDGGNDDIGVYTFLT
jgi:hypothetical protein